MPTVQELIHSMEEGAGARLVKWIGFLVAFLALAMAYDLRAFRNFSQPEAMDAAQVARNLAEGKGFTTHFIRPVSLHLVAQKTGDPHLTRPHPDLANPPAWPGLLAGVMRLAPMSFTLDREPAAPTYEPERWIAWVNQALFLLAAVLLYGLGRRLFDQFVAWLATAVFVGADFFWQLSVSGLPTMLGVVVLLVLAHWLVTAERGQRERDWGGGRLFAAALLAGVLVGAGGLVQYSIGWLVIPVMLFFNLFFAPRGLGMGLAVLLGAAAVLAPWVTRNQEWSGTLFGVAGLAVQQGTDRFPGDRVERLLNPENGDTPDDLRKVGLGEYWAKLGKNLPEVLHNDLPRLGGSWLGAFFLVGLLIPFKNPALNRLRCWVLLSLALLALVQALGRTHEPAAAPEPNADNLLVLFAPLVFLFGVGMFALLLEQLNLPPWGGRNLATAVFVVLMCAPLCFALGRTPRSPMAYPPYHPPVIQERARWLAESELMLSDMPWAVAWYGQRTCVWLPTNVQEGFAAIHRLRPVHAIYLTALTLDGRLVTDLLRGADPAWGRFAADAVVKEEIPEGFPLKFAFAEGFPFQLFLADRERWKLAAP